MKRLLVKLSGLVVDCDQNGDMVSTSDKKLQYLQHKTKRCFSKISKILDFVYIFWVT